MSLAKDERIGLVIAGIVAVAALGDFAYRQGKASGPSAPAPAGAPAKQVTNDQAARDGYAEVLAAAFEQDQNPAKVSADGTTLVIQWEMCSKQMLQRLLHDDKNYQVMNIRQLSGIGVPRLKSHGFKKISCDDGRKGLAPSVEKL